MYVHAQNTLSLIECTWVEDGGCGKPLGGGKFQVEWPNGVNSGCLELKYW